MREDSDTTVIVCRQDFAENRILYTYGRHAKELKNDGKAFLGPVFESMIEQAGIVDDAEEVDELVTKKVGANVALHRLRDRQRSIRQLQFQPALLRATAAGSIQQKLALFFP